MTAPRHRIALAATTLAVALTAACGKSEPAEPPPLPAPAPVNTMTITIDQRTYSVVPPILPGAVVTVVNHDPVKHSITSRRTGYFDYEVLPRQTVTFTAPAEPGVHPFYCKYHARMETALTVRR
ncbi:hypothetical protein [Nocardia sp. XZ_19_385]|uniref:hypothetical protein n=1 Tax=Nocardia sp. XZ_19_385 TaxID=2769488 RepID=UPI00188F0909|nr:hypothetical protein [Nocardia sp. XZ_19_385]